jgi:hypothetical protein
MENTFRKATENLKMRHFLKAVCLTVIIMAGFAAARSQSQDLAPSGRNEYSIMTANVPAALLGNSYGGNVDANCRASSNTQGWNHSALQRGAMDRLVSGVFTGNLAFIEDGVCAVEEAFRHQRPDGGFEGTVSPSYGPDIFWMAWQNHALWVLQNSPYWDSVGVRPPGRNYGGGQFSARINALKPAMRNAMNFLMGARSTLVDLGNDANTPNRTLINGSAYLFATRLLEDVITTTECNNYRSEGKWWVDNGFNQSKTSGDGVLFRDFDGVAAEHGGYDTSYQGTTTWFFARLAIHFKMPTNNAWQRLEKGLRWLHMRVLPDGTIDCTYNTRSGPNNQSGDIKATNPKDLARGLWYPAGFLASVGRRAETSAAISAAQRFNPKGSVNGLPPIIFSTLSAAATAGRPFSYTILATNAGAGQRGNQTLGMWPAFTISVSGLPPGLSAGPVSFRKSTGSRVISGMPTVPGTYHVSVHAVGDYGESQVYTLVIRVNRKWISTPSRK